MESNSFNISHSSTDTQKLNRTASVGQVKKVSKTNASFTASFAGSNAHDTEHVAVKSESPKRERSPNKRNKLDKRGSIEMSHITIDGPGLNNDSAGRNTPMNESKVTSTPLTKYKLQNKSSQVKSIMKNSSVVTDDTMDGTNCNDSHPKPKKRNKSVSFMLEDNEEVVNKKTKSNYTTTDSKNDSVVKTKVKFTAKKIKKSKNAKIAEKENKIDVNQQNKETEETVKDKAHKKSKYDKPKPSHTTDDVIGDIQNNQVENSSETKKKFKKPGKVKKTDEAMESNNNNNSVGMEITSEDITEKVKRPKKKKHQDKPNMELESDEPSSKTQKKDPNPDVVVELENLSIGDNAHTLSNLLDEMLVVDKDKRKKLRRKFNKNKKSKGAKTDTQDSEKTDDQEKVKWSRRKWNKDGKVDLDTTVIVDNLPLSMLFTYKKILTEHFVKYGLIKSVGIAEVYPTEESRPVFTTTINFYSDGAAKQALEDSAVWEGSRASLRRARPPCETTVVARSYAALSPQLLSSLLHRAGRLRNIRHLVKGKHSMSTYFVEFDGLAAVERALKLATDAKVAGKRVYLSRFEMRNRDTTGGSKDNASDADHSEDSQD